MRPDTAGPRRRAHALAVTALTALLLGAASAPAGAADQPTTWSVQPSSAKGPGTRAHFVYDLAPGASVSDYVGVTNLSRSPITLKLYASDAFNTSAGGFDLLPATAEPTDVGSWVKTAKSEITVPARRRLDVPFTLTVPGDAVPGDHVGGVVASLTVRRTDASGRQVDVDNRVGSRIYLRVTGPLRPSASLTQLQSSYTGTANPVGRGEVDVAYTVRNTGNTRLSGTLRASATGPFGVPLAAVDLGVLPELLPGNVFNGTTRVPAVTPALRVGTQLTVSPVVVTGEPGTESATAGTSLPGVTRTSGVWAVPWTLLSLLVLLLAGAWHVRRRRAAGGGNGAGPGSGRPPGQPSGRAPGQAARQGPGQPESVAP